MRRRHRHRRRTPIGWLIFAVWAAIGVRLGITVLPLLGNEQRGTRNVSVARNGNGDVNLSTMTASSVHKNGLQYYLRRNVVHGDDHSNATLQSTPDGKRAIPFQEEPSWSTMHSLDDVRLVQYNASSEVRDEPASASADIGHHHVPENNIASSAPWPPAPPLSWNASRCCVYAYLVGGINPGDPHSSYHGYLFTIVMNTHVMRETGSTATVVVWIQMAYNSTHDALPTADADLLSLYDIEIRYIPKDPYETFVTIQMEKFRIWSMTEYDRVFFLDSDIVVRASLDDLFWYSLSGVLEENVVISGRKEPANGGTFMITPHAGDYEHLQRIMVATATRHAALPYPHFDQRVGWGVEIAAPDYYDTAKYANRTRWDFHGVEADQGLLFYWTKYIAKSVTYLIANFARNWHVMDSRMQLVREYDLHHMLLPVRQRTCWPDQMTIVRSPYCVWPHANFQHVTGKDKPWLQDVPITIPPRHHATNCTEFWYATLQHLNHVHALGINFTSWQFGQRPTLGYFDSRDMLVARVFQMAADHN